MNIATLKENQYYIIEIDGEVDASSCILLDKAISEAMMNNETKLLVNCVRLTYISSAGLGVFMSYLQDFEAKGIKMILFGVSEKVKSVFAILGLDILIQLEKTKEDALASMQ